MNYFLIVKVVVASSKQINIPYHCLIGLYIVYFMRYDTYYDTHEVIFDMYQQYILSDFKQKNLIRHRNLGILMTKIKI